MNKIILMLLIGLPLSVVAEPTVERLSGTAIDKTFDGVVADGSIEIDNVSGSVVVYGSAEKKLRIKASLDKKIEGIDVSRDGGDIHIHVVYPKNRRSVGSAKLEIWLPAASSLDVGTVSADVTVSDVRGRQYLNSTSGDIETQVFDAELRAGSVSGDVRAIGNGGDTDSVSLDSVSGKVFGSGLAGDVDAESVSGNVELVQLRLSNGSFSTVSGNVDIEAAVLSGARVDFESVSGDIDYKVSGSVDGLYRIDTFSGSIDNCFGPKPEKRRFGPGSHHKFTEGNREYARIDMETVSGDIDICGK